jgi:hypothetical protein
MHSTQARNARHPNPENLKASVPYMLCLLPPSPTPIFPIVGGLLQRLCPQFTLQKGNLTSRLSRGVLGW